MNRSQAAFAVFAFAVAFAWPAFAGEEETPAAAPADAGQVQPAVQVRDAVVETAATPEAAIAPETTPVVTEKTVAHNAAADPVICKRFEQTGTRLRKGKVCRPTSTWKKLEKTAEDIVGQIEKGSATGIGGGG